MSVLNQSGEELVECPLCMEPLEVDDLHFYPCTCGYQICRFCWNRIREGENGLCPACRKAYPENPADFTPLSQEQVAAIKTEKKAREQKRRNKTLESRRALANVRVVQNNLVFVVGLPVRLADPEILKRQEYFGKYGKIHKVVINQSTSYAGSQVRNLTVFHDKSGPSASAYVTYVSPSDALRAIQGVNNVTLDGRVLKGSLGTTKYCANFMKNQPCPKPDCMYLHELGDPRASFTKEEMHAGLHQVYERKLHNQLLQSQKDKPDDKQTNGSGNSSTNAEKSSSKDGNQSNFIPTTVVTSSHINIVNSSKSNNKKEQNGNSNGNGNGNGNGNSNGNGSTSNGNGNGMEAWPSLGSSPPSDSPARKQPSPQSSTVKSQENGTSSTSESSSPILQTQAQIKTKDTQQTDKTRTKDSTTQSKKNKKQKTNSISNDEETKQTDEYKNSEEKTSNSVFESQSYLTNELDELESDRHSLLENHDLLDNSDHSLLEDDTHNLLNDTNDLLLQRHREMLAGLDNNINNHLLQKGPMLNGYGLLDREVGYLDRQISQISQGIMDQKEMLMRHNVMVEPKHFIPSSSIGLESASELLGANYHQNPNMLPPFGMRVDNSMGTSSMGNSITPSMSNMSANMSGNMSANALANTGFLLHNQQMLQNQHQMQGGMVNGYDTPQSQTNEGRYLAENMDKFFTDFYKAQQMRLQLNRGTTDRYQHHPHNMLSAERLEMEHKQRLSNMRGLEGAGVSSRGATGAGGTRSAAGDGDDDLDFDPFKETQKAFAELMETEMMHNQISSGDNLRRRVPTAPPGFSHLNTQQAFGMGAPAQPRSHNHHQGFVNSGSSATTAMFSDWSQMDPAIMSVNFSKQQLQLQQQQQQLQQAGGAATPAPAPAPTHTAAPAPLPSLSHQQQELFARFNQLGLNKQWGAGTATASHVPAAMGRQLPWSAPHAVAHAHAHAQYAGIPLPPGFAPPKPQTQHKPECIDAK